MSSEFSKNKEKLFESEKKLKNFVEILESIDNIDEKISTLWREIYENASTDRENAFMLYTDLYRDVKGNPGNHTVHGTNMSKYLERMCKSNDQLLRLAEIIERSLREVEIEINPDEVFNQISSGEK